MSNGLTYESLDVGARLGAIRIAATKALADDWRQISATPAQATRYMPEGTVFIFGLRALMDLNIIPPGGVLAGHDVRFHERILIESEVDIDISCSEKTIRKGRPFATLSLALRVNGALAIEDHMRVLWPTGGPGKLDIAPSFAQEGEFPMQVSQSAVERYANLSHDRNPIHLDAAYAATGPFGCLVVHAVIPAGAMLDAAAGANPSRGLCGQRANVKFLSPLRPGESHRFEAPLAGEPTPTWRCRTAAGNLVCIAELAPNE